MKKIKKNYDEQLIEQITNTLEMLLDKGFVYTYNDLRREYIDENTIRLSWNNHLSGAFNAGNNFYYFLGLSNSIITAKLAEVLSPTMNYELDHLKKIPIIITDKKEYIDNIVKECIDLSKADWDSFETSWDFEEHPLV